MITDPIGDFITRVRNASLARHKVVEVPASNMRKAIVKILFDQGYVLNYKFEDKGPQGIIKIALKYNKETKEPVIKAMQRVSRPGLRKYAGANEIPRILNGMGIAILSTSHGVMVDKEARRNNTGGEVLCYVY